MDQTLWLSGQESILKDESDSKADRTGWDEIKELKKQHNFRTMKNWTCAYCMNKFWGTWKFLPGCISAESTTYILADRVSQFMWDTLFHSLVSHTFWLALLFRSHHFTHTFPKQRNESTGCKKSRKGCHHGSSAGQFVTFLAAFNTPSGGNYTIQSKAMKIFAQYDGNSH